MLRLDPLSFSHILGLDNMLRTMIGMHESEGSILNLHHDTLEVVAQIRMTPEAQILEYLVPAGGSDWKD